jgi:hypothetical protein
MCALPERCCRECGDDSHEQGECNLLTKLPPKVLVKIMGYLSTNQLLELRKVNRNMNEVMVKIPISSLSLEGAVERAARILRNRVLPEEPFFTSYFKTPTGIHLLTRKLAWKAPSVSIGRTNIWKFRQSRPLQQPMTAEEFKILAPSTTEADYLFYANCVHPANMEEINKYEHKMELKVLKLVFRVQCEKYATIAYKDFKSIMDHKRYEVILADKAYMRRVHNRVVWAFDRKYNN